MGRAHIPFGYCVENGAAIVDPEKAEQIRKIYEEYISGKSFIEAAKNAGLTMPHCTVKRILKNERYLGDDFYPEIID